jgi:hypothetical protein
MIKLAILLTAWISIGSGCLLACTTNQQRGLRVAEPPKSPASSPRIALRNNGPSPPQAEEREWIKHPRAASIFRLRGWVIRFFNEESLCRQAVMSRINIARGDSYFHWRPPSANVMSERQPVHPSRHFYVCEDELDFFMKLERADCCCGVVGLISASPLLRGRTLYPS